VHLFNFAHVTQV